MLCCKDSPRCVHLFLSMTLGTLLAVKLSPTIVHAAAEHRVPLTVCGCAGALPAPQSSARDLSPILAGSVAGSWGRGSKRRISGASFCRGRHRSRYEALHLAAPWLPLSGRFSEPAGGRARVHGIVFLKEKAHFHVSKVKIFFGLQAHIIEDP